MRQFRTTPLGGGVPCGGEPQLRSVEGNPLPYLLRAPDRPESGGSAASEHPDDHVPRLPGESVLGFVGGMSVGTEAAGLGYLDYVAKPSPAASPPPPLPESNCRQWATVASCEEGHSVAKSIFCTREWCSECGQLDSDAHKRRWVRWLPKAMQLSSMGYLVITFPIDYREHLRTKEGLTDVAARIKASLIEFGFDKGLRRWHYFGECPSHPKREGDERPCLCPRGYHPHLNFLLPGGFLSDARLSELKKLVYAAVGMKVVIHYQYTDVPAKMMHLLKYVTRPTFLDRNWDNELADNLYGHRTTQSFGQWKEEYQWKLEETEEAIPAQCLAISKGHCPYCAKPISYGSKVIPIKFLVQRGFTDFTMGFWGTEVKIPDKLEWEAFGSPCYTVV